MFVQLLRYLCNCLPGRKPGGGRDMRAAAPREGATRAGGAIPEELKSLLDIPGIGPKTVRYLHDGGYASLTDIRAASEEELAAVEGVGPRAAAALKKALSQ
jgi:ERCC4-type nuclease